ncbi:putative integral membrane protein [Naematelia encephala]|uniref:Putative integral membrane protein n=1 Tax=Naematelia encephala TaxID=71784 RepID=A0A1Y2BBM6_9TREE|nr:putative integral membrane protein [Naematelia encephala]
MADLEQHINYTGKYSGLLDNLWVTLGIAAVCLVGYEIEVHIPRRRGRDGSYRRVPVRVILAFKRGWASWRRGELSWRGKGSSERPSTDGFIREKPEGDTKVEEARRKLGSREAWEFGYIFQPKAWRLLADVASRKWPLAWVKSSLKVRERDMPETCGLDLTLHARFLRGSFFYTLLQTCVVLPILLPLHVIYAPRDISRTSMVKASVSSLVESSGSKWLWVHAFLIWWITFTWTATVLWITWGALAYRRREIRRLAERVRQSREAKRQSAGGELGLKPDELDRWTVADDCEGIKKFRTVMVMNVPPDMRFEDKLRDYFDHYLRRHRVRSGQIPPTSGQNTPGISREVSRTVSNMRDMGAEIEQSEWKSEVEEVILVRKLGSVASLRARRMDVLRKLEVAHVNLAKRILHAVAKHKAKHPNPGKNPRIELLVNALGGFVNDEPEQLGRGRDTVWDVLHALPRELIDPYQSLTHLTSMFHNKNAPLIDYLTTKLNYLSMLLEEARAAPLSAYPTSSAAFVTFRDAKTARLALKVLDSHPKRSLACHTMPAPDWTDILWPRLAKSVYRSSFVRNWVVFLAVWAFTLVWIFPVSLFTALASLTNIAGFLKPLQNYLNAHPKTASAITSLAPVILVALLTLAICPILLLIANKAETITTRLGVHNSVLERFWKFLMVNSVVFFAIGQTAIEAYLTAFQTNDFDPLPIVASSFPTAAPYFASYILLQTAIQPFFEIFRFGLATIVYVFGTRVSIIPRQRDARTEHPTFSHFSQLPLQLLGGAIMHLFMLLNGPIQVRRWLTRTALVYYGSCYLIWKRQFTYVYGRLYETNGRRSSVRILRYSLDALAHKAKGHAIATGVLFFLTLIAKLV